MEVETKQEHQWLQKLVGEWTIAGEGDMGDGSPWKSTGRETVRPLGDIWVVAEGEMEMSESGAHGLTLVTYGFDAAKGRFVGSWFGTMMTNMWVYDGELDADGRTLTLECEGPSFAGDGTVGLYRDVIEVVSENERMLRSYVQKPDGTWHHFMSARYTRTK
jgi:hypothetical protein